MIFDFIMIMVIHVLVYNVGRVCQKLYFLKIEIINIYDYVNLLFGVKHWTITNVNSLKCDDVFRENVPNLSKPVAENSQANPHKNGKRNNYAESG